MSQMFERCKNFNQPLEAWNVSQVKDMSCMFEGCKAFSQSIQAWDMHKNVNSFNMFRDAELFQREQNRDYKRIERINCIKVWKCCIAVWAILGSTPLIIFIIFELTCTINIGMGIHEAMGCPSKLSTKQTNSTFVVANSSASNVTSEISTNST